MSKNTNTTINNKDYYRVTATVGRNVDGTPIRKQFYATNKKDAEEKRDEYLKTVSKGLNLNYSKVKLNEYFHYWLFNVKKPSVKDSSFERYECIYRLKIKTSAIGNMELMHIKSPHIQELCNNTFNQTNSAQAVESLLILLSSFFEYCLKEDYILKNPCKNVAKPQNQDVKSGKMMTFNRDEVSKITRYTTENIEYFIYYFALYTGLRQGEILALCHKDIDFDKKIVSVIKTVKKVSKISETSRTYTRVTQKPKTMSSIRTVPLSDETILHLKRHINYEKEKHLKQGIAFSEDSTLFTTRICKPKTSVSTLKVFENMLRRLHIDYKKFHCLRHTFCSMLAENGVSLKTASILMGHSNISTTAQVYIHISEEEKDILTLKC